MIAPALRHTSPRSAPGIGYLTTRPLTSSTPDSSPWSLMNSSAVISGDGVAEDDVRQLVEQTLARYGRLDVAFNNAGVEQAFVPMHESTVELYRQVFDTNVLGVLLSLKYEVPAMLRTGGGAIVNTTSIGGHIGMGAFGVYIASKHAVEGLTKTAALEYAKQGVRVNAVAPAAGGNEVMDRP